MFYNFKKLFRRRALTFEGAPIFERALTFQIPQKKLKQTLTFVGQLLLRARLLLRLYDISFSCEDIRKDLQNINC